ncbi:MAG: DNA polymerase I [Firmicutes bacterium]|nr:DNA polymerase I [Bacillota bacterium]
MKKLLLIDGSNLLFRAYYATAAMGNLMQNSNGIYTNGIYGLVSSMHMIFKMEFTHLLVALDPKGKTHRHEIFEEYKGTRKDTPSELVMQFPYMSEYFSVAGIPHYVQERYEADDIIGYCAKHFKKEFDEITIISNDHDLFQLLDNNVNQIVSRKGFKEVDLFTPDSMFEKLGFLPSQMTDYKGLVGDPSDNIPGVRGIGDKTAVSLLEKYISLENIYEHLEELKGKLKEKIESSKEVAFFSKQLATIHTDFENQINIDDLKYVGPDFEKLTSFYQKMEFHHFLRRMEAPEKKEELQDTEPKNSSYFVLKSDSEIQKILTSPMSIHLELFGSNYHIAERIGFGLASHKGLYYIPYHVARESKSFKDWLKDDRKLKYTFDFKQMKVSLLWDDIEVKGVDFDLLLAAYLINPNLTKEDFKVIVSSFDYYDVAYDEEIYSKGAKFHLPEEEKMVSDHVVNKAKAIHFLKDEMLKKNKEFDQLKLLNEIELPLSSTLAEMEYTGIHIDSAKLEEIGLDLKRRIDDLEKLIYDLCGENFNINSPKQLGTILFDKLQLPYSKKNKSGYSTDVSVLKQLETFHPVIGSLMEYRSLTKLYSTYYEGLKSALTLKNDSKIHTIYKQAATQTGRLSSIEPNLQNIPIKSEEGKELRKIFVTESNRLLFSCDYSQIELRVLAEMAEVKELKRAFIENEDVHNSTAKLIFHTDNITPLMRRQAKAINFGIIYGKTAWGLSEDLHISPKQAEKFISDYFENYPEIKGFMDKQIEDAKTVGYVQTMFQRRRYIPEATSSNYQMRQFGQRMAMNAPIQGSAADILKIAMVLIDKEIKNRMLKTKILLQIHDELVFSVPPEEKETITKIVFDLMEHAVPFSIPLTIEGSFGTNLFEVK